MGRMLGAFADNEELDRPDLNKCPDCGCFFPQDDCPLCGKPCPEEMRAGNREPPKKSKKRRSGSDRVVFVEWYHSWWFIILMMFFFPIVGIILLVTSPHKKSLKIAFAVAAILYTIVSTFGIGNIIGQVTQLWEKPVDTSLNREEYIAACGTVTPEGFYRGAEGYTDDYVTTTLTVERKIVDSFDSGKYATYYLCRQAGENFAILIRDCQRENAQNFLPGDKITVYGEAAENATIYDETYTAYTAPCINVAYATLNQ